MRKIFLACPYSHADASVTHERFIQCNKVAATIIEAGHGVFSQVDRVRHGHLAEHGVTRRDDRGGHLVAPDKALVGDVRIGMAVGAGQKDLSHCYLRAMQGHAPLR